MAWPPPPRKPPDKGRYDWRNHTHNVIGVYDTEAEAQAACEAYLVGRWVSRALRLTILGVRPA